MKQLLSSLLLLASCTTSTTTPTPDTGRDDASARPDVASPDVGGGDTVDAAPSSDTTVTPDASGCSGECATLTAEVTSRAVTIALERAFFGITDASASDSGEAELHLEAFRGGAEGCPEEESPTPAQTLIVTNIQRPSTGATYTRNDGLAVTLIDFEGLLVDDGLVASALTATVTIEYFDEDVASIVVDALLDGGGSATGRLYAERCDSLDFP